jgi:23S rRNA (guanosine2251-2'-O)-methyltransferase
MKANANQEIIFGIHPIIELLKAKKRKLYSIYTTKPQPKAWGDVVKLLPKYVTIHYTQKDALNKMAGTTDHQGIVALASPVIIRKKFFDPSKDKFLVMLDGIQDSRNLGAILRSAYCTGANGVIITQKATAPINAVAIKSSAGLSEHLEIYLAPTAKHAVSELKNAGYEIYLSALTDKPNANELTYNLPLCVVIGSEGTGISQNILNSGQKVTLPQVTTDISYNASVAAGILLYLISSKNKII